MTNRVSRPASSSAATRTSERIVVDGLLDAIEEWLAQLGQRELGLDAADIDGGDRLLHPADDRDLTDGHDAGLFLRRCQRRGEQCCCTEQERREVIAERRER